jgi:hypothetical protein
MTLCRQRVLAFVAFLAVLGATRIASADFIWDFWTGAGNPNGWTAISGAPHFRSGDGDGVTPANSGGGFAHDGDHTSFIYRSPVFSFSGVGASTNYGGGIQINWSGGSRYGNSGSGAPQYANPAAVLAFNGANSSDGGQRGLAFLNVETGIYDAVFYKSGGDGSNPTDSYTIGQLTAAGVNPVANYRLDFFETDETGWGWGQLNFINLAAGSQINLPEPTSIAIWALVGLGLAIFGYKRIRC